MSFLDNAGDILLDCTLTEEGRRRLARADGSFKISKFACGDDEVNYGLYDKNHPSGSAYFDLSILQTPVLEAFTNSMSSMKHRLISIPRNNLLYLPVVKLNGAKQVAPVLFDLVYVTVDGLTEGLSSTPGILPLSTGQVQSGVLFGFSTQANTNYLQLDQGLDTTAIPPSALLDSDLVENQYIIEIDNRFGSIVSPNVANSAQVKAAPSFIDDDNIASYYFSLGNDDRFVSKNTNTKNSDTSEVVAGPRGTSLQFLIQSSIELQQSTFLFEQLGSLDPKPSPTGIHYYGLDTIVRVTGVQTGASVDIPVRFIKQKA